MIYHHLSCKMIYCFYIHPSIYLSIHPFSCLPIHPSTHCSCPFILFILFYSKSDDTWQLLDETLERQCDERKRSVIRRYRNLKNNVFNKRDRGYQKTDSLKNYQFTIIKSRQVGM